MEGGRKQAVSRNNMGVDGSVVREIPQDDYCPTREVYHQN